MKKKLKKAAEVRKKLQRLANKNKLLAALIQLVMFILRRFYHIVQQIFFGEYPSPFDVVNMLVINQVRGGGPPMCPPCGVSTN
jgi:phosphate starvation-inducible membrane PsiE